MSDSWQSGVKVAELTHVGMRRANNQDSFAVMVAESADRFERRGHLFVVADGMGAHAAGELASKIASEQIAMRYISSHESEVGQALGEAVHFANTAIFERGQSNPDFHNMGTTASSLVLCGGQGYVAHVGDSRVYRLRDHTLEQLTFDHSLVWEMEASGQVDSDSPLGKAIPKNVITRSLGPGEHVMVDLEGPFDVQIGDRYLLCSDGLTGQIEDEDLAVLMDCLSIDKIAPVLIDLANLRGGPDNITVIVVDVTGENVAEAGAADSASVEASGPRWSPVHSSRMLLAATGICWFGAIGFGVSVALGHPRMIGSAIVAFVLGAIAISVWFSGILGTGDKRQALKTRRRKSGSQPSASQVAGLATYDSGLEASEIANGTGPYRFYSADHHQALCKNLNGVLAELKNTSDQHHWLLDWSDVDAIESQALQAQGEGHWEEAVVQYCNAALEAMVLLRRHQDDSASDTAVDL
ncbi:PP2C family protein-serine/threonine phosphatase [Neorhodopirellula lusitana]|uniref:PP2C family protein-serine/threonine phosphatase n=1 Tax=Neorhodopirellula lusitana TaxID=445327 RepID=UPI00384E0B7C